MHVDVFQPILITEYLLFYKYTGLINIDKHLIKDL